MDLFWPKLGRYVLGCLADLNKPLWRKHAFPQTLHFTPGTFYNAQEHKRPEQGGEEKERAHKHSSARRLSLGDGQEQAEMEINVVDKRGVEVEVEMEVSKERFNWEEADISTKRVAAIQILRALWGRSLNGTRSF